MKCWDSYSCGEAWLKAGILSWSVAAGNGTSSIQPSPARGMLICCLRKQTAMHMPAYAICAFTHRYASTSVQGLKKTYSEHLDFT